MRSYRPLFLIILCFFLPLFGNLKTHSIGVLIPLTGNLAPHGQNYQAALKLSQEDINQFFEKIQLPHRIHLNILDTESSTKTALKHLKQLKNQQVKLVIGPCNSAALAHCLEFANKAKMILISPSSTVPNLTKPGDNLIRMSVSDEGQVDALVDVCQEEGIDYLVCLTRDDIWGQTLHQITKEKMIEHKKGVYSNTFYPPDERSWEAHLQTLESLLESASHHHGLEQIAIHFVGFNEGVEIFKAAKNYPLLGSVKWLGSDGMAKNHFMIHDEEALHFAASVGYESPLFSVTEEQSYLFEQFQQRMAEQGHFDVDVYTGNVYDSLWIAALASTGQSKGASLKSWKKALDSAASHNLGITGWAILNERGDRVTGEFVTWKLKKNPHSSAKYSWEEQRRFKRQLPSFQKTPSVTSASKNHSSPLRTPEEDIVKSKRLEDPLMRIKRFSDTSTGKFYQ